MPAPTIRGTGIQTGTNSTYTVTWPSGTVAGDLALVFMGHGFGPNLPSGWTQNNNFAGSNWSGAVFSKILTSGDISTGSVTITFTGSFNGVLSIISIVGAPNINETDASRNGVGSTSISVSTTGFASSASNSLFVYFGSNRAASTDTVSSGTLQRQANDLSAASGCLYTETGVGGFLTRTFNYSTAGSGNYQAMVNIGPLPTITAANIAAPLIPGLAGSQHQIVKAPASVTLTPSGQTPVPVASALKGGTTGSAYSETIGVQGGTPPYTFAVTGGALPTGTSLNSSTGVISGTPTATGTFSFNITVTDVNLYTGVQPFTIAIAGPAVSGGGNYGYTA